MTELGKRLGTVPGSLSRRITLWAAGLTAGVVLAIGTISYGAMHALLQDHANDTLQAQARLAAEKLEHDVETFANDLASLSANSLLVNGLLDSQGRDIYLVPFLRDYKSPLPVAVSIVLSDFRARPIATNGPPGEQSFAGIPAVRTALDRGQARAHILETSAGPQLLLAQPMFYPATRQVEGVLIGTVNLRDLLVIEASFLGQEYRARLTAGQTFLAERGKRASAEDVIQVSKPLALGAPLGAIGLEVSVDVRREEALGMLNWVTWIYLAIGVVTLLAVFVVARYAAYRLTLPLNLLNRTAHQIAASGSIETRAPVGGADEIRGLATAFNHMLDRLRAFQELLESRVAERTAELHQAEQQLASILDSMHDVVWSVSPQTFEVLYVNPAAERVYGRSVDEFMDNPDLWIEAIHAADRNRVAQTFYPDLVRTGTATATYRIVRPDEQVRWVEDRGHVIRDAAGNVERLDGIITDITERRQAEEALRQSEQKLSLHFQQTPLGVIEWDGDFRVTRWNPAAEHIFGYAEGEALGRHAIELIVPENARQEVEKVWAGLAKNEGGRRSTNSNVTKDGRIIECEWYNTPLTDDAGNVIGAASLVQDVTAAKRYESELEHRATHDTLTGLPNRSLLKDRLTQAVLNAQRYGRQLMVAYMDLDRFKLVNNSLGHSAGDELLKMAAGRLQCLVRESDTVARLGGDEFVLLLSGQKHDEIPLQIAQRVLDSLAQPYVIEGEEVYLTCSVGISNYPQDGADGETLLKNADAALYRAKQLGRNSFYFYTADVNARANQRLSLQRGLRRAVDQGEFMLHYQPKVDLVNRRVTGLEALLRWRDSALGEISPAQFIPVLEETGMIIEVGQWIFGTAAADYARLVSQGLRVPRIAVNVSQRQLRRKDFIACLRAATAKGNPAGEWLDLEITESLIMEEMQENSAKLRSVQEMGVGIAIDDFGTGYSSLSYLARLPVSTLKIDQSFISRITSSPDDLSIVSMIISLAHSLKLKAVAEGVETEEQGRLLKLFKCDEMQGYLISRPVPLTDLDAMMRK